MRTPVLSPIRRMRPAAITPLPPRPGGNLRGGLPVPRSVPAFPPNDTAMTVAAKDLPLFRAIAIRGAMVMGSVAATAPRLGGLGPGLTRGALMAMFRRRPGAVVQALPLAAMVAPAPVSGKTEAARPVGRMSFAAPFRQPPLIAAILSGLAAFGEWFGGWTWAGPALVLAAGFSAIWRKARLGLVR